MCIVTFTCGVVTDLVSGELISQGFNVKRVKQKLPKMTIEALEIVCDVIVFFDHSFHLYFNDNGHMCEAEIPDYVVARTSVRD